MSHPCPKHQPLSTSRLTDQSSCATNSELQGEMLRLEFGVTYPKACRSTSCRKKFLTDTRNTIQNITKVLQLSITFDNGQSVELKLQFCSFSATPPGKGESPVICSLSSDPCLREDETKERNKRHPHSVTRIIKSILFQWQASAPSLLASRIQRVQDRFRAV